MVLWHEFDDNVACSCYHSCSEHSALRMSSFRQNNAREGRWFKLGFGLLTDGACVSAAPAVAIAGASLLKRPFASAANNAILNAYIENVTERSRSETHSRSYQ